MRQFKLLGGTFGDHRDWDDVEEWATGIGRGPRHRHRPAPLTAPVAAPDRRRSPMADAVIVDVVRTPSGRRNGSLSGWHPVDLAGELLATLVARNGLDPALVEDVIVGCVSQVGAQGLNLGRNAVLAAGFPESVPATTVDRQCGSSQQAAAFAAQAVMAGVHDVVIAAGVEVMSLGRGLDAAGLAVLAGRLDRRAYRRGDTTVERGAPAGGPVPHRARAGQRVHRRAGRRATTADDPRSRDELRRGRPARGRATDGGRPRRHRRRVPALSVEAFESLVAEPSARRGRPSCATCSARSGRPPRG